MNIIVSGATGFVGRNLVALLIEKGYDVTILIRSAKNIEDEILNKINVVIHDFSNSEIPNGLTGKYDLFFHFAWEGTSGNARKDYVIQYQNVIRNCNAIKLSKKLGCSRFVNAGSIMEYDCLDSFLNGYNPPENYIYNISKFAADYSSRAIANGCGIDYINVIISNIYGVGEVSDRFINVMIKKMLNNEDIALSSCEQLYDFIYITDAVEAILLAGIDGLNNNSYYIGNKKLIKLKEYVLKMHSIVGGTSHLKFGSIPTDTKIFDYKYIATDKLYELGFSPKISFDRGIELTKDWIINYDNGF